MKATHQGSCQVCGRIQKLPNIRLSLHGYTKKFGFFQGSCRGAYGKPFEQSHDLITGSIIHAKELIEKHGVDIWELSSNPKVLWQKFYNLKGQPWLECDYVFEDGNLKVTSKRTSYVRSSAGHAKTIFGNRRGLRDILVDANQGRVNDLRRTVAELESYIEWQEKRIADWKPAEIIPLTL